MAEERLALMLRLAWKIHRLDAIREVVRRTIVELEALDPQDVLGRGLAWSEELESGPIRAALEACCDELRDGCGLAVSATHGDNASRMAGRWTDAYAAALERYRDTAGTTLEASLGRLALSPT